MKKILTLLLLLAAYVSTASAKTIYLVNNWGKTNLNLYLYNSDTDEKRAWPGTSISETGYLEGSTSYYTLDLENYNYFIINYTESNDDGNVQTDDLVSSDYTEGEFYQFKWDDDIKKTVLEPYASTVYTYNLAVKTTESWDNFYIWAWNPSNSYKLLNVAWPGVKVDGVANVYNYTVYSTLSDISFCCAKGDGQPQTCDLSAAPGENKYNVSVVPSVKINESWGLTIKTNASGYATWVPWSAITVPSGIAYCAEDKENGCARAVSITNPAANTPMLIKGEANTTYHFIPADSYTGLEFTNAFKPGTPTTADEGLASSAGGNYNYILNGDAFYEANGHKVAEDKAYLQLSVAASARPLVFDDEETNGINVAVASEVNDNVYYNLSGQRIATPTKGLYIVNGRKTVLK